MIEIRTLDELSEYFSYLDTLPEARGPQDAETAIMPLLKALEGWDDAHIGALLLHLGMILAVRRGDEGIFTLRAALTEMAETLAKRQVIFGSVN